MDIDNYELRASDDARKSGKDFPYASVLSSVIAVVSAIVAVLSAVYTKSQADTAEKALALQRTPALVLSCKLAKVGGMTGDGVIGVPLFPPTYADFKRIFGLDEAHVINGYFSMQKGLTAINCDLQNDGAATLLNVEVAFAASYAQGNRFEPGVTKALTYQAVTTPTTIQPGGHQTYAIQNVTRLGLRLSYPTVAQVTIPPDTQPTTVPVQPTQETQLGMYIGPPTCVPPFYSTPIPAHHAGTQKIC